MPSTKSLARKNNGSHGYVMPMVLSFVVLASIFTAALMVLISSNTSMVGRNARKQEAFNIAEAGINYYLWHLSHSPTDFKDGKTTPATPDATLGYGPYVHNYIDDNSKTTGTYTLWIKPQGNGSTITTVRSIGKVNGSSVVRTIEAQLGVPSFASYAVNSDSALWFGNTERADGPVHSNQGVRMDGFSSTDVTSANTTYIPPSSLGGDNASHPGVWCSNTVTTPVNCATRNKSDWRYPVASIDFNQVASSLCTMKKLAFGADSSTSSLATQATACSQTPTTRTASYIPQRATTFSASKGYLIQLNTSGTYDLYNVNAENDQLTPYTSALTLQLVASNIAIASNGIIYVEDNVWIRSNPTFHGRVTIAAGRLATTNNATVTIADNVKYVAKDGSDSIGIVAEGDVLIAPYAPPSSGPFTYEIDAAIISQSGNVEYPLTYKTSTSKCTRGWTNSNQNFVYYGSVSVRLDWTWTWLVGSSACGDAASSSGNGYITGILNNATQYDYNLLYAPPPSFPLTSTYNILSWREVLTIP